MQKIQSPEKMFLALENYALPSQEVREVNRSLFFL